MRPVRVSVGAFAILSLGLFPSSGCLSQELAQVLPFDGDPDAGQVTWYRDVLPIAREHCQSCHQPEGIAPFSMMSWQEAQPMAEFIAERVKERSMPPWMPSSSCADLRDKRGLSDAEIATIDAWVKGGAVPGNPKSATASGPPTLPHLSSVDLTLQPDTIYTPVGDPADPTKLDDYHCFVLPTGLGTDRFVTGFEIVPGVTRQVHHVTLYTVPAIAAAIADQATPEPGYTCFGGPGATDGGLGGWLPGSGPTTYPDKTGVRLPAADVIVMQIHYNLLNGPPLPDRTTVHLDFSDAPVEKEARYIPIADLNLEIPPGSTDYKDTITFPWPLPAKVWGVLPHMHTLGTGIRVESGGKCLLDIPSWDFHWQQGYFFTSTEGLPINPFELVNVTCRFKNPSAKPVRWGESTSDEMCLAFLYATF